MDLEFKKDFDSTKENWAKFWTGTLGRPIILAVIPKKGMAEVPAPKWGAALSQDQEDVIDQALRCAESHDFLADSVPFFIPSLMVDLMPALLGAEIKSVEESWGVDTRAIPFLEDLDSDISLKRDSVWWKRLMSLCRCIKRKCAGRLVFGEVTPGYNLDVLGAIRGTERLMLDFYDNPGGVHHALAQILNAYNEIVDEYCRIFEFEKYGGVTRHGFFCDGIIGVPQCDFGFSIGKEHFDEFALPYLKKEIDRLDAVEYHLDGPGNIVHAESICGIEKIGVIQWVAGAGSEGKDWSSLYRKIAGLGKGLWLGAGTPDDAFRLWNEYGQSGRMILSCRAETEGDVEKYFKKFE